MLLTESLLGSSSTAANYIEDVFSTYLYTGNSSTQTITNGIDLSTKGGMVWAKRRDAAANHVINDTARGASQTIYPNLTNAQQNDSPNGISFNTNGFTVGALTSINTNTTPNVSWTFRKQAKFFDVVTYTGNGTNRTIAHNLGSVPGCILIKRTDTTADWQVYHRSLANTEYMVLNTTAAKATGTTRWNSTTPTSTVFSLGTDTTVNANGGTYVAYLFAHDAGGFGAAGTDNVISCGSFTQSGSTVSVTLGYEPQFILAKQTGTTGSWFMYDIMRGLTVGTSDQYLQANAASAEATTDLFSPTSTGFTQSGGSLTSWIYIAIRRGPMKTPTSGTSVFSPVLYTGTGVAQTITCTNTPDFLLVRSRSTCDNNVYTRIIGANQNLYTNLALQQINQSAGYGVTDFRNVSWNLGVNANNENLSGASSIGLSFSRAPGFFDVVCYTGNDLSRNLNHNLGVAPQLWIIKARSTSADWSVGSSLFSSVTNDYLSLNLTDAKASLSNFWNTPTTTTFGFGSGLPSAANINASGQTYVAYLFATLAGVSKVGTYTGNGTNQTINCGFTGGARFILIKRTDSTGNWFVWDTARGIVAGNDPYLLLNSTAAEVTTNDSVDTDSTGFIVNQLAATNINVNAASYIYLAIA